MPLQEYAPLAPYTALGVGGSARFLVKVTTEEQILNALEFARERACPVFVLGGGSNIVVSDSGFPGLVIKIEVPGIRPLGDANAAEISAGAGVEWDAFVDYCVKRNLAGVECLSGIPGTVGGAPVQNIGAYGEEASDVIGRLRALDREAKSIVELGTMDCQFAYRSSVFNTTQKDRYIILRVEFALRTDGKPRIHYQDLQRHFGGGSLRPEISEVREAVLQIRRDKSMVLQENDPDSKSVGSFFKNPILTLDEAASVEERSRRSGILGVSENIPRFAGPEGMEKFPAAWLIERAGFHKGYVHGRAGISTKHALAIINRGGANASEILDLMHMIQNCVLELYGVELKPEPVLVGFDD